jgi:hypothetical protein
LLVLDGRSVRSLGRSRDVLTGTGRLQLARRPGNNPQRVIQRLRSADGRAPLDEEDTLVSPLGAKGAGEAGITGAAAAIGNAVYHATGKRVRELPITLDRLL